MAPGTRLGRELALERDLLGAGEVARGGRLVRIAAHPFVGEFAEEIGERALRRQRRRRSACHGERREDDQATQRGTALPRAPSRQGSLSPPGPATPAPAPTPGRPRNAPRQISPPRKARRPPPPFSPP